ncbi:hypothetical protein P153DRAFT_135268 [Dothidotthia symphoricarpi CBS 119687]|uniref:Uncharacterized protein n=1 Tax=Dothidotthia symphoricarpi CBS 119687 TaxID=1392245 RepID=A0A6A5ZYD4_9PLEO|nr:uncharacterized protein P153DRAFT_135268 [Dothidotthia symphoricarpi CBS 119687]KAF2124610.1 hypothetical protein P153DRAFT_135268 [Dothidotthia symphoricarpi CBS 119687]
MTIQIYRAIPAVAIAATAEVLASAPSRYDPVGRHWLLATRTLYASEGLSWLNFLSCTVCAAVLRRQAFDHLSGAS